MHYWTPTHEIEHNGQHIQVMLDTSDGEGRNGPLYTRDEWEFATSADYEMSPDGRVLFQGQPFRGIVRKVMKGAR